MMKFKKKFLTSIVAITIFSMNMSMPAYAQEKAVIAGDSGRVWGSGKVYATGPWTDWEVAYNSTLYVKYETKSN